MDLSNLSDAELRLIAKGDLRMLSTSTLESITGKKSEPAKEVAPDKSGVQNFALGALNGAANIGSTLLTPVAAAVNLVSPGAMLTGEQRRKSISGVMNEYANPESMSFKAGELGSSIAGTAGAGGVLAKGASLIPALTKAAPALPAALESGGFSLGGATATTGKEAMKNIATRLAGGSATGAATAGLVNPEDAATGAAIGAGMAPVAALAGNAGKLAKAAVYDPIFNQDQLLGKLIQNSVGTNNVPSILSSLNKNAATPGVNFSMGQRTLNPGIAGLEDTLRAINPNGALAAQDVANRSAIASGVRSVSQDDIARAAAVDLRKKTAEQLYSEALDPANQNPLTPWLKGQITQLLKRPSINEASKKAQQWAIERGEKPSPNGSLAALHDVKTALDDMISKAKIAGEGGQVKALENTQNQLLTVLEKLSPKYEQARTSYAQLSQPINQMDIGQFVANKLLPATTGDVPVSLNANKLAQAMRNPDQLAKSATGFNGATLEGTLTPEQLSLIRGITSDTSRMAEATKLGIGSGSPTARRQAIEGVIGDNLRSEFPILSSALRSLGNVPVGNAVTNLGSAVGGMASKRINAHMMQKLENALANDPQALQKMLLAQQKKAMQLPSSNGLLMTVPRTAAIGLLSPANP